MRRTRMVGALIATAVMLLLSGCVRFQSDLTVTPENLLHGDIVVASIVGDGEDGTTVSWNTSYEGSLDMHAVASTQSVEPPTWVWMLIGVGGVTVIAATIITMMILQRRSATT